MAETRHQQVVERLFHELRGQQLSDWVRDQRDAGVSWRRIEKDLYADTDGAIDISHPTLITWYGETAPEQVA